MARRILQVLDHSIESHDMLRLHHENGHEVADLGGYIQPDSPHDDKRPALPQVPMIQVVKDAVDALGQPDNLLAAKEELPYPILDWADTIIWHHNLGRLYNQWPRIRDWLAGDSTRRVIWRSVGQSVDGNEIDSVPFRKQGLERVAYSPKEQNIPGYSGHDALIRFGKDPDEWNGWVGDIKAVGNVTQNLKDRDPWTHYGFWMDATEGLPCILAGPGSESIARFGTKGIGALPYDEMRNYLRTIRAYFYTGTQPASYTLGLIEALMTGTPVVSIGPGGFRQPIFPYVPEMFEGHEIAQLWSDTPEGAKTLLTALLNDPDYAAFESVRARARAIELFGIETIREQWRAYLG